MAMADVVWHGWPPQVWTGKKWEYVMPDPCPECGKDRVLVGYRHLCVPLRSVTEPRYASYDPRLTPPQQLRLALARVAELEEEVKLLKRELARARGGTSTAMTAAERMRLMRKRKAEKRI
jgi:hypothetical protein